MLLSTIPPNEADMLPWAANLGGWGVLAFITFWIIRFTIPKIVDRFDAALERSQKQFDTTLERSQNHFNDVLEKTQERFRQISETQRTDFKEELTKANSVLDVQRAQFREDLNIILTRHSQISEKAEKSFERCSESIVSELRDLREAVQHATK